MVVHFSRGLAVALIDHLRRRQHGAQEGAEGVEVGVDGDALAVEVELGIQAGAHGARRVGAGDLGAVGGGGRADAVRIVVGVVALLLVLGVATGLLGEHLGRGARRRDFHLLGGAAILPRAHLLLELDGRCDAPGGVEASWVRVGRWHRRGGEGDEGSEGSEGSGRG